MFRIIVDDKVFKTHKSKVIKIKVQDGDRYVIAEGTIDKSPKKIITKRKNNDLYIYLKMVQKNHLLFWKIIRYQ